MSQPRVDRETLHKKWVSFIMQFNFIKNNFLFIKNIFDWMVPFLNIAYNRDLACLGNIHR